MDRQRDPYRVEDPRFSFKVAMGLWPDCPDCHGLLAANEGSDRPYWARSGEAKEKTEIPFPCPTCHKRTLAAGVEIRPHYWERGPETPFGTWPDCTNCNGIGGSWRNYGGHDEPHEFFHCGTCRNRTKEFLLHHPTELDHLLQLQHQEVSPHIEKRHRLLRELRENNVLLAELSKNHNQALKEHASRIREQLLSSRQSVNSH